VHAEDNAKVFDAVEVATRTAKYASSIAPFQRTKNGRAALMALRSQHAGDDKWTTARDQANEVLHKRVWKGQTQFTLESFIAQHRNAYVQLQQVAEKIPHQLPNEFTRVDYLLKGIECGDPQLQAAIAAVKQDKTPTGMQYNFELAAAFIQEADPVARKRAAGGNKRGAALLSDASGEEKVDADVSATHIGKQPRGKTGVEFRFYKREEYSKLSKEQKDELRACREKHGNFEKGPNTSKAKVAKVDKKVLATAVKDCMTAKEKDEEKNASNASQFKEHILSVARGEVGGERKGATVASATATEVPDSTLNQIMKKVKFA